MTSEKSLYDLSLDELTDQLAGWGFSSFYATAIWKYLYQARVQSFEEMNDLRPELVSMLKSYGYLSSLSLKKRASSRDSLTTKYLFATSDGQLIETVLMSFQGRTTACVSTQVGCAMGCVFCATGQMGFYRNLRPGEIIEQALFLKKRSLSRGDFLRNIVFMGMGEPLHNYDATMKAVNILTDSKGLAFGPRYLTISTVGLPNAIRRLADEAQPVNLAVSLHAADDKTRNALIPVNHRWNLADLMAACRYYVEKRGRRIFFEWALIAGENDTPQQAHALAKLLDGMEAHVNLIPLNPTDGYSGHPTDTPSAQAFQAILSDYMIPSTIRQRRGIDIDAGCGQLRSRYIQMEP